MKRASLSVVPVAKKTERPDVTDRILSGAAPAATGARTPPRAATPRPPAARPRAEVAPQPVSRAPQSPKREAAPTPQRGPALPAADQSVSLDQALKHSRTALAALVSAAHAAPARYNLGLRYRLDALAHHLEQVAEFTETIVRKK